MHLRNLHQVFTTFKICYKTSVSSLIFFLNTLKHKTNLDIPGSDVPHPNEKVNQLVVLIHTFPMRNGKNCINLLLIWMFTHIQNISLISQTFVELSDFQLIFSSLIGREQSWIFLGMSDQNHVIRINHFVSSLDF